MATFGIDSCVTTNHGTNLATGTGASYAAPVVSAVLAALRTYDPSLTADQAEQLLLDNADTVGGVKVLNAARAFRANPNVAALAKGAPITGLGATVANLCEAPPAPATNGGASPGGALSAATTDAETGSALASGREVVGVPIAPVPPPTIQAKLPTNDQYAATKPAKPRLRSVTMRRTMLTVRISGRQRGDRVLVNIDGIRLVRESSLIKVRLKAMKWRTIRIWLQRPGIGTSERLIVRSSSEF
jgi:hypothetical protein